MRIKKLVLLIGNNLKNDVRSWKYFLLELLIIAGFITISLYSSATTKSEIDRHHLKRLKLNERNADINNLKELGQILDISFLSLLYIPIDETTQTIINEVSETLALSGATQGFDDVSDMLHHFNKNTSLAAVVFHKSTSHLLDITMRFPSQFRTLRKGQDCWSLTCFWSTRLLGLFDKKYPKEYADFYVHEGFLQLQNSIFKAWVKYYNASLYRELPTVGVNSFVHDPEKGIFVHRSPIAWHFYYFLYFVPFLNLVWKFSREQEENIPQHYSNYGFSYNDHFFGHFIVSFINFAILNSILFTLIMMEWPHGSIYNSQQTGYLLIFVIQYNCMLILNAFILSTLNMTAKTAVFFAASLWVATYGIFSFNLANSNTIESHTLIWLLVIFNNFFPFGLVYLEDNSEEKTPQQIWLLLIIQICSILFYWSCLQFLDRYRLKTRHYMRSTIYPGPGCLMSSGDVEKLVLSENTSSFYAAMLKNLNWSYFEYGPVEGHLLMLQNVTAYEDNRKQRTLLKNITMRLFENEIAVVLGPLSSGKTTLISVLAGWRKYEGHIYYEENKEISQNWSYYCRHIDVSMSENPLYDLLTVEEQIYFIILNKMPDSVENELRMELNKWLTILKSSIADFGKLVKTLNFDQKRLLTLCCILSCKTRIILLDEPTLHMRHNERQIFWQILQQEKLQRAIIMTTTSIDEANEMGDRIAILNQGSLKAWGTPFYLKTNLSKGTYLVLFLDPLTSIKPITQLLEKYIPTVSVHCHNKDRITYILPEHKRPLYQRILIDLEKHNNDLGISNMYITGCELNDIYMDLTKESDVRKTQPNLEKSLTFLNDPEPVPREVSLMSALFYKKLLYQAPNVIPIFIIFLAFLLIFIIYEMSQRVNPYDRIEMGFNSDTEGKEQLMGLEKCKYLEITQIGNTRGLTFNWRPEKLFISKLKCGYLSYKEDLFKDAGTYTKFGAIEKDGKSYIKLWLNERVFHSAALTLNLAHNVILNDLYPNNSHKMVNIQNEPIWEPVRETFVLKHFSNLFVPLTWGIIMPLTMSTYIVTLIEERQNHMQILERISGATTLTFWLTNFIWDYAMYIMIAFLYFLVMCVYTMEEYLWMSKLLTLLLLSVYGLASLLLIYTVCLFVSDHKFRGFLKVLLLQMIFGYCTFIIYWEVRNTEPFWYYLMMFSPTFALTVAMANVQAENMVQVFCKNRCAQIFNCKIEENACSLVSQCCPQSLLQWYFPGILPSFVFLLLTAIILSVIFISITNYRRKKLHSAPSRIKELASVCYPYDDELIISEKLRISNMDMATCKKHAVLVDQLEYEIPKEGNRVKIISFALNRYECLGIYALERSGKTHLIKQLIGEDGFSFGEVYICGNESKRDIHRALTNLGYCPQTKGFCEGATPRQIFTLFFMLRGAVTESNCNNGIRDLSITFNLRNYMNTRLSELPGHIRRRINIAITLIVHNKVLIFDEPTRGLDARERRLIWHVMCRVRDNGNAVIFTSQESLELEQVADFIIAVDNGEMLALGSPQIIRHMYTSGFYLDIKLKSDGRTLEEMEANLRKDIENLQRFIAFLHTESELLKRNGNVLKYYLPIETVSYSYVFGTMEKNRQRLNIAEYMITQGSLYTAMENLRNARKEKIRYEKGKAM